MTRPSALESATPPVGPRPASPTRCVLLVPGAIAQSPTDNPAPLPDALPRAGGQTHEDTPAEDESADPVGDGHSDAELAHRLEEAGSERNDSPVPPADTPLVHGRKGHSTAP